MMTNEEITEKIYPCQLPVKVIGENNDELKKVIVTVMASLGEVLESGAMASKHSKNKKYLSITFSVVVRSREHIDQIFSALNAQKEVKMVL
jgi:putative lipoic acid-binding regulatory protein